MESEHITKAGFLTKQGDIIQSWKRRWFILQGTSLKYFKDDKHLQKPKGIIDLITYKVKRITNLEFCSKTKCICSFTKG